MIKLDENVSRHLTSIFAEKKIDAHSVHEEQLEGATDDALFEIAKKEQRCLVTFDLDFTNILRYPTIHTPGIIVIRPRRPVSLNQIEWFMERIAIELSTRSPRDCLWIMSESDLRVRRPKD